jgi:uncharacterized protein YjeT (DUF2065 family)
VAKPEGRGPAEMERAIEAFVALTSLIVGASHIVRRDAWVEAYGRLSRNGRPGAFVNGGLSLAPGAAIVAGHGAWSWPGGVLTAFGWLLVVKGLIGFLTPDLALRSMERAPSRVRFAVGGVLLMAVGAWATYCFWRRGPT